jgi:outer membrane protein assembly factor BamB
MMMFALSVVSIPSAHAQVAYPTVVKTYAYIAAEPSPVGVGQSISLSFGIDKVPMTADGDFGDRWTNFTIVVTDPTGHVTDLTGFTADDTGFAHTTYTPTMTGNYTFLLQFGGQTETGANPPPGGWTGSAASYAQYIGDYYQPSTSSVQCVEVQTGQISTIPFQPLPTNYWTRPINMMNNNWNMISGNWFGDVPYVNAGYGYNATGQFDPYMINAPTTCHILWQTPIGPGGLIGGEYGNTESSNFYATKQYECSFKAVVMDGVIYYTVEPGASTNLEGTIAVNIRTGQTIWEKTESQMNGTLALGWILNYVSPNQYGGLEYLWTSSGTTWSLYDATTGNYVLEIIGGTTPEWMNDASGNLLGYYVNATHGSEYLPITGSTLTSTGPMLTQWNATAAIMIQSTGSATGGTTGQDEWRPVQNAQIPWKDGVEWAVPIATSVAGVTIPGTMSFSGGQSSGNWGITGNTIMLGYQPTGNWEDWQIEAGYSIINGAQLFIVNRTVPTMTRTVTHVVGNDQYVDFCAEDQTYTAFNAATGAQLWVATFPTTTFWGYVSTYFPTVAYGLLYCSTFDGNVYAFNDSTGALVWNFNAGSSGYNNVYGTWPIKVVELVAGGEVFLNGGHTYNPPMFRGSHVYAINATTGKEVWQILSFAHSNNPTTAAGDGEVFLPNSYDNMIVAYGMGPTKTTVTAPQVGATTAMPVTLTGTVTDLSAGSQQNSVAMNFPNGLPAVSDASQEGFMEAVYEQQPMPTNMTGVTVTLTETDHNGNTYTIGSTTTDPLTGTWGYNWTPPIPGNYTITATFAGSGAYYGSYATTYVYANSPAATPGPTASPVTGLASTSSLELGIAAVIIVIVIIGAVLALLMLRKRP